MPLKHDALQGQLERAQAALSKVEAGLGEQVPKKNPAWRRANSRVKQIEARQKSRTDIANITAGSGDSDE